MRSLLLLNPRARHGTAGRRADEVVGALRAVGLDVELRLTEGPGHGEELARRAVLEGRPSVLVAGGDGSVHDAVNGLMRAAGEARAQLPCVGLVPVGSSNDLAHNLGVPARLSEAAAVISAGRTRQLDVGRVDDRYFVNNSALAVEALISRIHDRIRSRSGLRHYLPAAVVGVLANPCWQLDLEWEGGSWSGAVTALTVGNGARTGGRFYMAPHADPFDGRLSVLVVTPTTRRQLLRLLPRTTRPGDVSWLAHGSVREISTDRLTVRSARPVPAHADGENLPPKQGEIEYRVLPGHLPVLVP